MGSDPYNKRNGYSSSNNGLSHGVSSYSTPAQDALIDQMKAEGLLSEFEKGLLISNRSFRFASSIIDEHMEEHKRIVAARKREEEEKAKRKDWFKDQLFRCDPVLLVRIDEIPDEAKMDVLVDRCAEVADERREHYAKLFDKWKSFF